MFVAQTSWLTPSEIFTPFYGRAVANFVLDRHAQMAAPQDPLRIFEIGGGTGTLARDVLQHVRVAAPELYGRMEYCSVEISPALARAQAATVTAAGGHGKRFRVRSRFLCPCQPVTRQALAGQINGACRHTLLKSQPSREGWIRPASEMCCVPEPIQLHETECRSSAGTRRTWQGGRPAAARARSRAACWRWRCWTTARMTVWRAHRPRHPGSRRPCSWKTGGTTLPAPHCALLTLCGRLQRQNSGSDSVTRRLFPFWRNVLPQRPVERIAMRNARNAVCA